MLPTTLGLMTSLEPAYANANHINHRSRLSLAFCPLYLVFVVDVQNETRLLRLEKEISFAWKHVYDTER